MPDGGPSKKYSPAAVAVVAGGAGVGVVAAAVGARGVEQHVAAVAAAGSAAARQLVDFLEPGGLPRGHRAAVVSLNAAEAPVVDQVSVADPQVGPAPAAGRGALAVQGAALVLVVGLAV